MARAEMDPLRGRNGRPWLRVRAQVLTPGVTCTWHDCPWPDVELDLTLPPTDPWSATVDHVVELAEGGHPTDPSNLTPMHRWCNGQKEIERRAAARASTADRLRPTTKARRARSRRA